MLKYAFYILSLMISIKSSAKEKQDLHVFIGAGWGHAEEALRFLNIHQHHFEKITIYVPEDSLYTVKKLNLITECLKSFEWHFNMRKQFNHYKIKKVPSFVIGTLDKRKRNVLTLPQIENHLHGSE